VGENVLRRAVAPLIAYHASGSIKGIYEAGCELFKKRMECAIMLAISRIPEDDE